MKNSELIKKLDPNGKFSKNSCSDSEYVFPEFNRTLSVEEVFLLHKNDNLDISLLERTEDGKFENIDNRLVSNYTFVQSTKKHVSSLIKCFVKSDIGQNDMLLFVLSPAERFELTLKGEVLCSLANSWKNSNLYLKLKIVEWEEIIKANFKDN